MSEEDDMEVVETAIPEVKIITPKKFGDDLPVAAVGRTRAWDPLG